MTRSDFDFDDLVGEEFDFFYGDSEPYFKLDDTTYEVQEDGEIVEASGSLPDFGLPVARVIVEWVDTFSSTSLSTFTMSIAGSVSAQITAIDLFSTTPQRIPTMSFKVQEQHENCCYAPQTSLEVDDIRLLPRALKRLAELGYDMEPSLEALQEAVEEQRKQKVLQAAINAIAEPGKKR